MTRIQDQFSNFCTRIFLTQKLRNWVGIVLFIGLAGFSAYLVTYQFKMALTFMAGLFGVAGGMVCLLNPRICFYSNVILAFIGFHISRIFFYYGVPLSIGIFFDTLVVTNLLGLIFTRGGMKQTFNEFAGTSVVVFLLIIYGFFFLQLFNPNSLSFFGWYNGFRKLLSNLLLLFVSYNIFTSMKEVRRFIWFMFVLSAISGAYACVQEWRGLTDFEMYWLMSDPHGVGLAFIGGTFRKFGTMSDPAAFAISMAVSAVFFIVLLSGNTKKKRNFFWLTVGLIFMITGMTYSGTRTANAMLVAGGCFFILLAANRPTTYVIGALGGALFLVMLYGPFNSPTIQRFRSTFSPDEDPSYKVRENNRKSIQYYMHTHPIGGGLATTGGTGKTHHPGHPLAGFQPDNGYLKKALETGYIGLLNYLILYFLIFLVGIRGYFSTKDKERQVIYAAALCAFFCFYVGEYAQKATGQITSSIVYYPLLAIILKMRKFDQDDTETENHHH